MENIEKQYIKMYTLPLSWACGTIVINSHAQKWAPKLYEYVYMYTYMYIFP